MQQIKILTIGKTKESWLDEALGEYHKRLKSTVSIELILAKDNTQLIALAEKEANIVCLDAAGSLMTSEEFAQFLHKKMELGGSRLTFVIGGAAGLPLSLKNRPGAISLSRMTFTHQIVRLVLIEQIYRAYEIAKGSGYHK